MDAVVHMILQTGGVLAPILVLFGWYILQKDKRERELHMKLMEVQEKRIADAQMVANRVMEISDQWAATFQENTRAIDEVRALISQLRVDLIVRRREEGTT